MVNSRVPPGTRRHEWWLPEMQIVGIKLTDLYQPPPVLDHERSTLKFQSARGAELLQRPIQRNTADACYYLGCLHAW